MMLMLFITCYLLPMLITWWLAWKCYKDRYVSTRIGIESYVGLIVTVVASIIPVLNTMWAIWLVAIAVEYDAFKGRWNIHK